MREDLLHFVWKYQKLRGTTFKSTKEEEISVHGIGIHNKGAGPDFFNAKIEIDGQLWAGNVEIHLKSSDWYSHGHEIDSNYDNVILHVVWEHDVTIFRKDNTEIPTLELKDLVPESVINSYQKLLLSNQKRKFINCEKDFSSVKDLLIKNWLERLYIERLEKKSSLIHEVLIASANDWEKAFFCLLMKNFGLNINGDIFLSVGLKLDFSVVRKSINELLRLEALLFGSANLLNDSNCPDPYFLELKKEYDFLKNKFGLETAQMVNPAFFGLRPNNFPTIRLSQIAKLYHATPNLLSKVIEVKSVNEIRKIFKVTASSYWDSHFTFGKESKGRKKKLTDSFIDLLIVNTVVPIKFCYAKHFGKDNSEELISLISQLKPEKNTIIEKFDQIGAITLNSMESQSKLQLYNWYCSQNKCLQCAIGAELLNRKS